MLVHMDGEGAELDWVHLRIKRPSSKLSVLATATDNERATTVPASDVRSHFCRVR